MINIMNYNNKQTIFCMTSPILCHTELLSR